MLPTYDYFKVCFTNVLMTVLCKTTHTSIFPAENFARTLSLARRDKLDETSATRKLFCPRLDRSNDRRWASFREPTNTRTCRQLLDVIMWKRMRGLLSGITTHMCSLSSAGVVNFPTKSPRTASSLPTAVINHSSSCQSSKLPNCNIYHNVILYTLQTKCIK